MNQFQEKVFICGQNERDDYDCRQITHLVTVANPGVNSTRPSWFAGKHVELWFGDVASEADAASYNTTAPGINDIERALSFFRAAWAGGNAKILVTCDYGASRSPALAYICIADCLGPGREADAFNAMLDIRPDAVPNGLVVRLGDIFLERKGALFEPLKALYNKIDEELFAELL